MTAEIEGEYEKVKDKFMVTDCATCGTKRPNYTWSKLDFATMASRTPLGKIIVQGYFIPLRQAHATVTAMTSRMAVGRNNALSFLDAPQREEADHALRLAHHLSLDVLNVQDERFAVSGLKEQIGTCFRDWLEIWGKPSNLKTTNLGGPQP
jgi:hypothetical protein